MKTQSKTALLPAISRTPAQEALFAKHYDIYDRVTVNECRSLEWRMKDRTKESPPDPEITPQQHTALLEHLAMVAVYCAAGERYLIIEDVVAEMVRKEEAAQRYLATVASPKGIACLSCRMPMAVTDRLLHKQDPPRVLFVFECPRGCRKRRGIFEDGQELETSHPCPSCGTALEGTRDHSAPGIVIRYRCSCGHESVEDLGPLELESDPDFEKDRERFYISPEEGADYRVHVTALRDLMRLQKEDEERKQNQDLYDQVAQLQTLTVFAMEHLLATALEVVGFVRLVLSAPESGRAGLVVPFTLQDSQSRTEAESLAELRKSIDAVLAPTNWTLMAGVSYQLGLLQGRLRGVTTEEDRVALVGRRWGDDRTSTHTGSLHRHRMRPYS